MDMGSDTTANDYTDDDEKEFDTGEAKVVAKGELQKLKAWAAARRVGEEDESNDSSESSSSSSGTESQQVPSIHDSISDITD